MSADDRRTCSLATALPAPALGARRRELLAERVQVAAQAIGPARAGGRGRIAVLAATVAAAAAAVFAMLGWRGDEARVASFGPPIVEVPAVRVTASAVETAPGAPDAEMRAIEIDD